MSESARLVEDEVSSLRLMLSGQRISGFGEHQRAGAGHRAHLYAVVHCRHIYLGAAVPRPLNVNNLLSDHLAHDFEYVNSSEFMELVH